MVRQNLTAKNAHVIVFNERPFVESFGPTSRTTSDRARTSRSARMLRWDAPSSRPAASWCDPRSAVCTTDTNGSPPDRACCAAPQLDVGVCLRTRSKASRTEFDLLRGDGLPRVDERRFLGELTALENRLLRGCGDGQLILSRNKPSDKPCTVQSSLSPRVREKTTAVLLDGKVPIQTIASSFMSNWPSPLGSLVSPLPSMT